jgi:sulfur carrier protein ThiS
VTVTIDGQERSLWTTATSVEQVLSMLQLTDEKTIVSTSRSAGIGREGLSFSVTTPKDVTLNVDDESEQLVSTVRTVEELLKEHGVTLEEGDTVEPGLETELSSGLQVAVTRAPEPEPEPEPEPKPEPKKTESTSTKASAEPKASSTPKASSAPKESAAASSNSSVWDALAQCESGGNWSINSGNGYYGGLQFSLQTWRAYGGTGMPHEASKAEQIAVAEKIKAGQGWGAWPACSSKLGLR